MRNLAYEILAAIIATTIILAVMILNTRNMERSSLEERVATLEELMREKSRPVIYIQRGTVYNSDGEVVIEDRHKDKDRHQDTKTQRRK